MILSDLTVPSHLDHVLEEEVAKDLALTKKISKLIFACMTVMKRF